MCGEAASYFRHVPSVLSSCRCCHDDKGGRPVSLPQVFRRLFIDAVSLPCLALLTKHTSHSSPPSSVLCDQLYSLCLCTYACTPLENLLCYQCSIEMKVVSFFVFCFFTNYKCQAENKESEGTDLLVL